MLPGLLVKLRPTTPWRVAPESGARERSGSVYHSDNLFSAITLAMKQLGLLEDWLTAAVAESPAVRFSSCYPFLEETLYIVPPRNLWPPSPSSRVRWKGARFVPVPVVETLVKDPEARIREDEGWVVDAESECLLRPPRSGKAQGPFRIGLRRSVAVDRLTGTPADPVITACLEFAPDAGLWFAAAFANEEARQRWSAPLQAALRLLADSGFGGERSRGWGRSDAPLFTEGLFPDLLMSPPNVAPQAVEPTEPSAEAPPPAPVETAYWLLSLFSPSSSDSVDWNRGAYSILEREGRTESPQRHGERKRSLRMVGEGSVLLAAAPPVGSAPDVAPEGFPHPVYRAGFALSIPIMWRASA